ncbi:hypothetical protein JB92DRAFT_1910280 [Gautieria morchelliformis]|nr:hypothetical protein JB92DRAFT_1910280 [Gautieria morchelliformis]
MGAMLVLIVLLCASGSAAQSSTRMRTRRPARLEDGRGVVSLFLWRCWGPAHPPTGSLYSPPKRFPFRATPKNSN